MIKSKFILLLYGFLTVFNTANAANMCVKDDTLLVVLDPQIGGSVLSSNSSGKTWSVQFSYGVISGIGGCGPWDKDGEGVVSSSQDITAFSKARNCHCKILRPVESMWVHANAQHFDDNCTYQCAADCAQRVASSSAMRTGLFGNIAN